MPCLSGGWNSWLGITCGAVLKSNINARVTPVILRVSSWQKICHIRLPPIPLPNPHPAPTRSFPHHHPFKKQYLRSGVKCHLKPYALTEVFFLFSGSSCHFPAEVSLGIRALFLSKNLRIFFILFIVLNFFFLT